MLLCRPAPASHPPLVLALLAPCPPPAHGECAAIDDPLLVLDHYLEMDPADRDVARRDAGFEDERTILTRPRLAAKLPPGATCAKAPPPAGTLAAL